MPTAMSPLQWITIHRSEYPSLQATLAACKQQPDYPAMVASHNTQSTHLDEAKQIKRRAELKIKRMLRMLNRTLRDAR